MVKGFPSEYLVVIGDRSGYGIGGVGWELHAQFLIRCDVASSHGTWIVGSRARVTSPESRSH